MADVTTLGNRELLKLRKVAFFASSKSASLSVIPSLDWASDIAKREDVAVCSGFQSPIEKKILEYLLRGKCGIIVALCRGMYRKIPEVYSAAFESGRILFVGFDSVKSERWSRPVAERRNRYLADLADELVFASLSPDSSLFRLSQSQTAKPKLKL